MSRYEAVTDSAVQDSFVETSTDPLSCEATRIEGARSPFSTEDQSPISRLPMELLSKIFLYIVSDKWLDDSNTTKIVVKTLARVCAAWRAAAHGTAGLWTVINSKESHVSLDDQLAYSAALPLHLDHWEADLPRNVVLSRFLGQVGVHMQRVESLFFSTTCESLAAIPVQNMPALLRAHIIYTRRYNPNILNFLANATALTDLTLQGARCNMTSHVDALRSPSFPSLTRMTLVLDSNVRPEWFLSTIAQCGTANLTFLDLAFSSLSSRAAPALDFAPDVLTLPVLRTLVIANENHKMLRHMHAPQLESIVFRDMYDIGDPFVSFGRFLAHTPLPSVRTLELHETNGDYSALLACLALLPDLDRMAITWGHIDSMFVMVEVYDHFEGPLTEELLDRMTGDSERPPLVPRLTSVDFNISHDNCMKISKPALRRFIRSRRAPSVRGGCSVAALEKVRVAGIYDTDNDFECDGDRDGAVHSVE
ncbi:hypothetical protein BD626DRAFT_634049 [Schizophyllum amplum]|uniref:Uncharacterized protein n=1 Tax=Schizophyllum amplum TaxID=97359 RepID=A0A550C0N3_9AGAR|nr:hypothetical protein BD626DRAFT_634049 [Auriculariopsis ampla]